MKSIRNGAIIILVILLLIGTCVAGYRLDITNEYGKKVEHAQTLYTPEYTVYLDGQEYAPEAITDKTFEIYKIKDIDEERKIIILDDKALF